MTREQYNLLYDTYDNWLEYLVFIMDRNKPEPELTDLKRDKLLEYFDKAGIIVTFKEKES